MKACSYELLPSNSFAVFGKRTDPQMLPKENNQMYQTELDDTESESNDFILKRLCGK